MKGIETDLNNPAMIKNFPAAWDVPTLEKRTGKILKNKKFSLHVLFKPPK